MSNATLSFLPWVRQGAASAINVAENKLPTLSPVATVAAALTLNGDSLSQVPIRLRGPADVIGIGASQVVRTDPRAKTTNFEANCFPSIEFDRPDFPWLFTPARANDANQLRPWLCLIVVEKQPGVTLASTPDFPMPTLTIESPAVPARELPDLRDSWAWAHGQVAANDSTPQAIDQAFLGGPELTLSRLLCPRFLVPSTDYIACVVPTFEVGRRAGLGIAITDQDLTKIALAPAWTLAPAPVKVLLPVFYHWEFRTGVAGDFESLAKRLTPAAPEGLGKRAIDISAPGFPSAGATTAELEGALMPIEPPPPPDSPSPPPPVSDPIPLDFKKTLAGIINAPNQVSAAPPTTDPLLAPPMYGRWHAGKPIADATGTTWLDQLNLDPRWRAAAAFGTRVVQEHQEALMASAWEQAAQLQDANQRMRQLQLSLAVGETLHRRHFSVLTEEMVLRVAAPAFGRLRPTPSDNSLLAAQSGTRLQTGANRAAMRRIGRLRGPLTRRVASKGTAFKRSATDTWVARLNNMYTGPMPPPPVPLTPPPPPPPPTINYAEMPALAVFTQCLYNGADNLPQSFYGAFFVAPENAPVTSPGVAHFVKRSEAPDFFRSAAREHLDRFFPARPLVITPHFVVYQSVKQTVIDETNPRQTLATLVNAVITTGDQALAPTARGVPKVGVETVMAAPYFPQPMFEPLRDVSQDLLLPGLDKVKPESVVGLRTNRRFVEAYMVGLNHEMGRELLWRGYPTDQRGTYFDRFWGQGVPNTAPPDITDLERWSLIDPTTRTMRKLGDAFGAPALDEEFVMLLRSSLLLRYPNAVVYLTPAIRTPPTAPNPGVLVPDDRPELEEPPIFSGAMQPDIAFFGFPVTTAAATGADGGLGYYVVIQEHPTEPRFGVDDGFRTGDSHLAISTNPPTGLDLQGGKWNTNAAEMARITRRLPVRMAIHAARLMTAT